MAQTVKLTFLNKATLIPKQWQLICCPGDSRYSLQERKDLWEDKMSGFQYPCKQNTKWKWWEY